MFLYLLLNLGSISIPLVYSFEKKMRFIRYWKEVVLSLSIISMIFLIWDAIFTANEVWGFNADYHLNILIFKMPIEEWMFFFCIPYASFFIHYSFEYFLPNFKLGEKVTKRITIILLLVVLFILVLNFDKAYTAVNYSLLSFLLIISYFYGIVYLRRFYIAFLIILIPFFIVNGILTGTGLEEPVVWYNDNENLGMRLLTIPVEDIGYAFTMIFGNVFLIEKFKAMNLFKTAKSSSS